MLGQRVQAFAHRVGPAYHGGAQKVGNTSALGRRALRHKPGLRRLHAPALAAQHAQHALVNAAGQELRLVVAGRCDQRHPDGHIGRGQVRRGLEQAPVQVERLHQEARRKVRCKSIGQAALGRKLR